MITGDVFLVWQGGESSVLSLSVEVPGRIKALLSKNTENTLNYFALIIQIYNLFRHFQHINYAKHFNVDFTIRILLNIFII